METPCYIYNRDKLKENLRTMKTVSKKTGIGFFYSLKGFSFPPLLTVISKYIKTASCSSLYELLLAKKYFKKKEIFSPAYEASEIEEIADLADIVIFNSIDQLKRYKKIVQEKKKVIGIRINPKTRPHSTAEDFNPVSKNSRFGVSIDELDEVEKYIKDGTISYIHIHALNNASMDELSEIINKATDKMGTLLNYVSFLNIGGGVQWTNKTMSLEKLIKSINKLSEVAPKLKLLAEPCESVLKDVGDLATNVIDIVDTEEGKVLIVNTSFQNNLLDAIQYPYLPIEIKAVDNPEGKEKYSYLIGGNSCLTGDLANGKRMFNREIKRGDLIIFKDIASYSKVQSCNFNGLKKPNCYVITGEMSVIFSNRDNFYNFLSSVY